MDELIDKLNNLTISDETEDDIKDLIIGIESLSINPEVKEQLTKILLAKVRCIHLYAINFPKYIY